MNAKSIKFTVLGSGSAVCFEDRTSASYLVETNDRYLLLDCGFNCVTRICEAGVSPADIDYIFLSHKHPDHFMGLIHLLFALKSPFYNRSEPVCIFGFPGLISYFTQFKEILGKWIEPGFEIIFQEDKSFNSGGFQFDLFSTLHSEESSGINIVVNNKKISYTSDTGFSENVIENINGSDLAILDCAANIDNNLEGHMNFRECIEMAEKAYVKRALLSHFYPDSISFDLDCLNSNVDLYRGRDMMTLYL